MGRLIALLEALAVAAVAIWLIVRLCGWAWNRTDGD